MALAACVASALTISPASMLKAAGLSWPKKRPPYLAGLRDHGHRKVTDDRASGLSAYRSEARFCQWIGANIVAANDAGTTKGGLEVCGVARQAKLSKRLTRRSRERIEQGPFALAVGHVVEEGAKLLR
jgi:hypothetical protein